MKRKASIGALTIVLFAAGGLIAATAIYQLYTSATDGISHREAIEIALAQVNKEQNRNVALYPNEKAGAKLIHVTDDGTAYNVDENTRADMVLYSSNKFRGEFENTYLWHVVVETSNDLGEVNGYWYLIDTSSGKIVGDYRNEPYELS